MKCISCDKDISINAQICPYCHRDTTLAPAQYIFNIVADRGIVLQGAGAS